MLIFTRNNTPQAASSSIFADVLVLLLYAVRIEISIGISGIIRQTIVWRNLQGYEITETKF